MITVFGIPNCSTVKKARAWLDEHGVSYRFHDYKKEGLDPALLETWAAELGWQALLNTRGTTWRGLPESDRTDVDEPRALALMASKPSLVRRPLIAWEQAGAPAYLLGFDADEYQERLVTRGQA